MKHHNKLLFSLLMLASLEAQCVEPQATAVKLHKAHYEFMQDRRLYDNPTLSTYVQKVGQKIVANSDKPNKKYHFFVIDDPDVNALTPGHGLIYVFRGLLGLMTSEGQLAGVLAHEIGHNVGRHNQRGKTKRALGSVGAVVAAVMVGNSGIKNAIDLANAEKFTAFRRELELEADEYGAEYLYRSGYDPQEMLDMLGQMKDYSNFMSRISGSGRGSYHGVFASHPRTDKRLQEVVLKAGTLPPSENFRGREEFRNAMMGVAYGQNYDGNKRPDQERFTQKNLGITFVYPKEWSQVTKGKNIILKDADKTVQLKISVEKTIDKSLNSKTVLETKYPSDLTEITKINEKSTKDLGTHARKQQQRVAVIQVSRNSYHFQGIAKNNQLTEEQDRLFIEIIESFRRASRKDLLPNEVKKIYYRRLEPGETFSVLAAQNKTLGMHTEAYYRLMNGYYPKGEAEPGTYIKMVE